MRNLQQELLMCKGVEETQSDPHWREAAWYLGTATFYFYPTRDRSSPLYARSVQDLCVTDTRHHILHLATCPRRGEFGREYEIRDLLDESVMSWDAHKCDDSLRTYLLPFIFTIAFDYCYMYCTVYTCYISLCWAQQFCATFITKTTISSFCKQHCNEMKTKSPQKYKFLISCPWTKLLFGLVYLLS